MSMEIGLSPDGQGASVRFASGHSVNIPLDHRAGPLLAQMLYAQQSASAGGGRARPGEAAAPLQSMVDRYLRGGGQIHKIEPRGAQAVKPPKVNISLEELFRS